MSTLPRTQPPGTLARWQPPAGASRSKRLHEPRTETLSRLGDAPTDAADPTDPTDPTDPANPTDRAAQAGPVEGLPVGFLLADRYVIEEHISDGGFGAVYRASDREISSHRLAIKLLHRPAETDKAQQNALRELVLIASVSHPSVVQFKDYGWHQGRLWFAMPFFDGQTLDARVERDHARALSTDEARPIFELLARGLAAMHEVGVNHHDIKPENIFLAEMAGFAEGLPVLLDLGIAAKGGEAPRGFSPAWVAPETAKTALGDKQAVIGDSADVFSLALVLRVLLEPATAPNTDLPTVGLLTTRAKFPVPPPDGRGLQHLRRPFERWLNLDPGQRPTAAEFAAELAVLTAPQERRAARFRTLRRAAPFLGAGLLTLAALGFEVQRQRGVLHTEQQRLEQKTHEGEQLRALSFEQRSALERQQAQLGEQDEALRESIDEVATLDSQLNKTARRKNKLQTRLKRLATQSEALEVDVATLKQIGVELSDARDTADEHSAELSTSLEALGRKHELTLAALSSLELEHASRTKERDGLQKQAEALRGERDQMASERRSSRQRERELRTRAETLERDVQELRASTRSLRKKLAAAEREAPSGVVDRGGQEPPQAP